MNGYSTWLRHIWDWTFLDYIVADKGQRGPLQFILVTALFAILALVVIYSPLPEVTWLGQSASDEGIINSNRITVYSSIPSDLISEYLADFQAKHPRIEVNLVNEVTLRLTNRILDEADAPEADVIWGMAVTSMLLMEWHDLLTHYEPQGAARVNRFFWDDTSPPHWFGISGRSLVFCINTDALHEAGLPIPLTWHDLMNPVYEQRLVMPTPGKTSVGYLLISAMLQLYGESEGWEHLARLDRNTGLYASNVTQVCPTVVEGEYPIGVTYDYRALQQRDSENSIVIIYPGERTGWELEVNALVRKEEIKPAAQRFLDWAISDDAMRLYAKSRAITTVELDARSPESLVRTPQVYLLEQDIPWIAANRSRLQKEWLELFGDE